MNVLRSDSHAYQRADINEPNEPQQERFDLQPRNNNIGWRTHKILIELFISLGPGGAKDQALTSSDTKIKSHYAHYIILIKNGYIYIHEI